MSGQANRVAVRVELHPVGGLTNYALGARGHRLTMASGHRHLRA